MLRDRLKSALGLISLVLVCCWLDYRGLLGLSRGLWLLPLLLFFTAGTAWEMARMFARDGRPVRVWAAVSAAVLTTMAGAVPLVWENFLGPYPPDCPVGRVGWLAIGAVCGIGVALAAEMSSYRRGATNCADRLAVAALVGGYVGVPIGFLVVLRGLGSDPEWGLAALLTLIAVIKASDAGAYFVGKAVGRHKLIPQLSPGKTWEGAIGGVLSSIGVAYLCLTWLLPALHDSPLAAPPWWGPVVLGSSCAVAGMFGDLAESLIKRDTGVKDSGGLLPGMGGVWDVTDSLIGAALPGFLCFLAGVGGTIP